MEFQGPHRTGDPQRRGLSLVVIAKVALALALVGLASFAHAALARPLTPVPVVEGRTLHWTAVPGATSYRVDSFTWTTEPSLTTPYSYLERVSTTGTSLTPRCRSKVTFSAVAAV